MVSRRRGGPGLMSTMARTAVISSTAARTTNRVNSRAAAQSQAGAGGTAPISEPPAGNDMAQMQAQLAALQAQQVQEATPGAAGGPAEMMAKLQQLVQFKESGMLTDEEFSAMKAKLLAG